MSAWRAGLFLRLGAVLCVLLAAFLAIVLLPSAPSISIVQATSEAVSFDVAVPEMAQIRLAGFALYAEAAAGNLGFADTTGASRKPLCLAGILVPLPGTRVTYRRFHTGPVSVTLERRDGHPVAEFDLGGTAAPESLRKASWIRLEAATAKDDDDDAAKPPCAGDPFLRLPVYGIAEIGTELRPLGRGQEPSGGALIEGTVDIFVRTLELGGLVPQPRIYPAGVSGIALPPGSRVMEYAASGEARRPWAGFVMADADEALGVKLTTEARRLAIVRPGIGLVPEVLSFSLFAQLLNDPTLQSVQVVGAFLFSVLYSLGSAVSRYGAGRPGATRSRFGR